MTKKEHLQKLMQTTNAINAAKKPGQRRRTMVEVAIKVLELGGGTAEERAFLADFVNEALENDTIAEYYEGE